MRRLHYYLSIFAHGGQNRLHEKNKTTGVATEEVVLLEELHCLEVVYFASHDHKLAFLDLFGQLLRLVRNHLGFQKSFGQNLEN